MPHQRPPEPKSEHCKGHLHRRRAPENRSARPAQPRRQRGRNLPVFLRCSCSLDHPPEIVPPAIDACLLERAPLRTCYQIAEDPETASEIGAGPATVPEELPAPGGELPSRAVPYSTCSVPGF